MSIENKKVLIAILSVAISAGSVYPAFARPAVEVNGGNSTRTTQTRYQTIQGTIKSIVGEVVTINVENRGIQTFRMSQQTIKIMGLVPGMRIAAVANGQELSAENIKILPKVAAVRTERTETTRAEVTTKKEETRQTQRRVVTPPPRPMPSVEIRQQETRETQQRRVVTPAPAPATNVEPIRPVRGLW